VLILSFTASPDGAAHAWAVFHDAGR
jgi:hypothetical protein